MRTLPVLAAAAAVAFLTASCGSGFDSGEEQQQAGKAELDVLVATSGPADLGAVKDAAKAWADDSGDKATVTAAQDINQQLSQGFASGNPPDVFMVDAAQFTNYASAGNLEPYGDSLSYKDDFYPTLRDTFTYDGKFYCAPKDFSTLGLVVNTDLWKKAGLTDADVPTTWDQLETVARKLTKGGVTGLGLGNSYNQLGPFLLQAGGWVTNDDQTAMTADTGQNLQGLRFVRKLLKSGVAKYPKQLGSGWSGEALGKGKAAMVIEGNWLKGGMSSDFPDLNYRVHELPKGPAAKGTMSFTVCWGIAAKSKHKKQAQALVESFLRPAQQLTFAEAFGVMPSRESVRADYQEQFPDDAAWLAGSAYARPPVTAKGMTQVMADFDTGLQGLPKADPERLLRRLQKNGTPVLKDAAENG